MADAPTTDVVRSRRALLAAAAGSAAALAVSTIRPGSVAATATPMLTEQDNPATTLATGVTNATADVQAFYGHAAGDGNGLEGTSLTGHGVRGVSTDASDPVNNVSNAGVVGVAGHLGSISANISLTGVYGYSDASNTEGIAAAGVWGQSPDLGVAGDGTVGVLGDGFIGVLGAAADAAGVGVLATTDVASARALRVEGRAEFTRSGRVSIAAGTSKRTVTLAGCTSSTLVFANLAVNRSGRWVRAVVTGSGRFTIYLNNTVGSSTLVQWIAFTNPGNHAG